MNVVRNVDKAVFVFCKYAIIVLFGSLICATTIQVFFRYVMNNSLTWTEEYCRFAMIWMTMLGIGVAVRKKAHIAIDFIYGFLPGSRAVLERLHCLAGMVFALVLIFYGLKLAELNMVQLSAGMGWKMGYMYYSVPGGAGIVFFYSLLGLFGLDKKLDQSTS